MVYGESIGGKSSLLIKFDKRLGVPFFARLEMASVRSFLPVSTVFTSNCSFLYLHFFKTFKKYRRITDIDDTKNQLLLGRVISLTEIV